jgi:hypothetical protein
MDVLAISVFINRRMGDKGIDTDNHYFLYFDPNCEDYIEYMQWIKWSFAFQDLSTMISYTINSNASRSVLDYCNYKKLKFGSGNCLVLTFDQWAFLWKLDARPLEVILAIQQKNLWAVLFEKKSPKFKHIEIDVDLNITSTITEHDD